jgi:hypothetical protein
MKPFHKRTVVRPKHVTFTQPTPYELTRIVSSAVKADSKYTTVYDGKGHRHIIVGSKISAFIHEFNKWSFDYQLYDLNTRTWRGR